MPYTLNGLGTWYYGKRRIHTVRATCQFCGHEADLASYDTTLFFVVIHIPVIPLGQKRILEQCAHCRKHRVLGLAKWEEAKSQGWAEVQEKLDRHPNDRTAVLQAIDLSLAYQDEPLFMSVVEMTAGKFTRDAAIQARLGDGYAYFSRWPNAEQAYFDSLAVDDNETVRQQFAWTLLKQGRPDEARPYLKHIIDNQKSDSAWLLYYLVAGYQSQGRHDEALEVRDEFDRAFPDLAADKLYQKQRQASIRDGGKGKRIRSAMLAQDRGGYREGSWTARLPRWIATLVVLGCLGAYFGSAFWIGQARKVYFVNGTGKPYAVVINGARQVLAPNSPTPIRVAEGELRVEFADAKQAIEPVLAQINTSFWTRPFASHTFIINPDQSAIVVEEESFYAQNNPRPSGPPTFHFGHAFYSLTGIDYEFQNFPPTLQVNSSSDVRKTRVMLANDWSQEARFGMLQSLGPQEQIMLGQKILAIDPGNTLFLYWLATRLPPEQAIKYIETRLNDIPILVEWHRVYQSLMERNFPEKDLRERYRKLLADNEGNATALYLLGRADPDLDEGEKLIRQATTANPPSGYAFSSLGFRALCEGRFADAIPLFEKALPLLTEKTLAEQLYYDALLANGDYEQLLQSLRQYAHMPDRQAGVSMQMMRVQAIRGNQALARQELAAVVRRLPPNDVAKMQLALESVLCCCTKDVDGYLKAVGDEPTFEAFFLRGELQQAAGQVNSTSQDALAYRGLIYLDATRSGALKLAEVQWQALLAGLKKGGRDEQRFGAILAGGNPPDMRLAQQLLIEPQIKRVLLVVLAQRFPSQAKDALALARRLDFQHDAISMCLAKFLKQP